MILKSITGSGTLRRRVSAAAIAICLAAILVAAASGCGSAPSASATTVNPFGAIDHNIRTGLGLDGDGIVVDGGLITFKSGSLRGVLPSVKPEVVNRGNKDLKRVALTLDDGWNPDMRIMTLLKDSKIGFTTFLIGDRGVADAHPEFLQAILNIGGQICSHTWSHYIMRQKTEDFVVNELWKAQQVITNVSHVVYPYVRFCGGDYDKPALDWTGREGYWVINWTIDSRDSNANPTLDGEVNAVLSGLCNGAIILCHWGGHNTYDVLTRVIPEIKRRGYEITNLSGVLEGTPYVLTGTNSPKGKKSSK